MPIRNDSIELDLTDYPTPGVAGDHQRMAFAALKRFMPANVQGIQHAIDMPWHVPLAPGNPWGTNVHQLGVVYLNLRPPTTWSFTLTSPDGKRSIDFLHLPMTGGTYPYMSNSPLWDQFSAMVGGAGASGQYAASGVYDIDGRTQGKIVSIWDIPDGTVIQRSNGSPQKYNQFVDFNRHTPVASPYLIWKTGIGCDYVRQLNEAGDDYANVLTCYDGYVLNWDRFLADCAGRARFFYVNPSTNRVLVDPQGVPYTDLSPSLFSAIPYDVATDNNPIYGYGPGQYAAYIDHETAYYSPDQCKRPLTFPMTSSQTADGDETGTSSAAYGQPYMSVTHSVDTSWLGSWKGWSIVVHPRHAEPNVTDNAGGFVQVPAFYEDVHKGFFKGGMGMIVIMIVGVAVAFIVGPEILAALAEMEAGIEGAALTAEIATDVAVSEAAGDVALMGAEDVIGSEVAEAAVVGAVDEGGIDAASMAAFAANPDSAAFGQAVIASSQGPSLAVTTAANTVTGAVSSTVTQGVTGHIDPLGVLMGAIGAGVGTIANALTAPLAASLPSASIDIGLSNPIDLTAAAVKSGTSALVSAPMSLAQTGSVNGGRILTVAESSMVGSVGTQVGTGAAGSITNLWNGDTTGNQMGGGDMRGLGDVNYADDGYYPGDSATGVNAVSTVINTDGTNTITYDDGSQVTVGTPNLVSDSASSFNTMPGVAFDWTKSLGGVIGSGAQALFNKITGRTTPGYVPNPLPTRSGMYSQPGNVNIAGMSVSPIMLIALAGLGYYVFAGKRRAR